MKKQLLVLILIASLGCTGGHYAFMVQTLKDNTYVPVEDAQVILECPGDQGVTYSNKDGKATINKLNCDMKSGEGFGITVSRAGCNDFSKEFEDLKPSTMNTILLVCK